MQQANGFAAVDPTQPDQPPILIRFATPAIKPIAPAHGKRWAAFTITGTAYDLISGESISTRIVVRPPRTVIGFRLPPADTSQPAFPIRAAFFYAWYPNAWTEQGIYPFTNFHPSAGFYNSTDLTLIRGQIDAMRYGNIRVGIYSWNAAPETVDRFPTYLAATRSTPFRWAVYYEQEGYNDPSPAQITTDLTYIRDHYAMSPSYLKVNGKFVVFVYRDASDACGYVDRWKQGNTVGAYLVLGVFEGYRSCSNQPDGWHQYGAGPTSVTPGEDAQLPWSFTITPGFDARDNRAPTEARDLTRWQQNILDMVGSQAQWQLVSTFNEWPEGTAVESAQEWATSSGYGAYLDALHAVK